MGKGVATNMNSEKDLEMNTEDGFLIIAKLKFYMN